MDFTHQDIVFYATTWVFTFAAGLLRTLRDRNYSSGWDCITVGGVGGFYGFSIVTVCSHYGPSISEFGWGYIGISVAIGSLGKEQDKIMRNIYARILNKQLPTDKDDK